MQLNQNNKLDNGKNKKNLQPTHRLHQWKNKFEEVQQDEKSSLEK